MAAVWALEGKEMEIAVLVAANLLYAGLQLKQAATARTNRRWMMKSQPQH